MLYWIECSIGSTPAAPAALSRRKAPSSVGPLQRSLCPATGLGILANLSQTTTPRLSVQPGKVRAPTSSRSRLLELGADVRKCSTAHFVDMAGPASLTSMRRKRCRRLCRLGDCSEEHCCNAANLPSKIWQMPKVQKLQKLLQKSWKLQSRQLSSCFPRTKKQF